MTALVDTPLASVSRGETSIRPWDRTRSCLLLLAAWCGVLFVYGLTAGELWRTEGLRALVAQEMLWNGNWIVPTLYGQPMLTKPPGMYWAMLLCSYPLGVVTELTARLPSVLAACVLVFAFFGYLRRFLGNRGALVAGLLLPISPMWLDKVPAAEIDMLQVMWVGLSLLCFFRAVEASEANAPATRWWCGAMLAMAGGFLTKWTAPAFFYATAVSLLWWRGRLRLLLCRHHLVGLGLALTLALGWMAAAASEVGWEVFWSALKQEALPRLVPNYEAERPYRFGDALLHPVKLLATTLPGSILALYTLMPGFARLWDERRRFVLQALHAWVWPNMLVWSYIAEHTPRHSFPLFPGLAGLAAFAWLAWSAGQLRWTLPVLRPAPVLVVLLVGWLLFKVVFVEAVMAGMSFEVNGRHVELGRSIGRQAREKAALLAKLVPAGKRLYVRKLKDEGIMFYYGRPVLRLDSLADLPVFDEVVYCILVPQEWEEWDPSRPAEVVSHMIDEQGDPIVVVRVSSHR